MDMLLEVRELPYVLRNLIPVEIYSGQVKLEAEIITRQIQWFKPKMVDMFWQELPNDMVPEEWTLYVVKLDSTGALQWTRTIGGPDDDWGNAIVQTKDGGYAITGGTKSFGYGVPGLADIWVIKLDSAGNKKWTKTVEGPWGYR